MISFPFIYKHRQQFVLYANDSRDEQIQVCYDISLSLHFDNRVCMDHLRPRGAFTLNINAIQNLLGQSHCI